MHSISVILIHCAVSVFQTQHQLTAEEESLKQSDHVAKIAAARTTSIENELARLGANHAWAGKYYSGDGLGVNVTLLIAPETGFVFQWEGCLGLYDRNYGTATMHDDHLHLTCHLSNDTNKGFEGTPTDFTPVHWGERRYLIANDKLVNFCNAINSKEEPRKKARGFHQDPDSDPVP
jgi:hypothetical protein